MELPDLFPGYEARWIDTSVGRIFTRVGGSGPPLLLLHGYAQTHVMWHAVAPALAKRFTLVMPDLPGYGASAVPAAQLDHAPYTKRAMANVMVEVMRTLGYERFRLAGHDRGGRVAYRLAFDHPTVLQRLAVLDVIPTWSTWMAMDASVAFHIWNWSFLALPAPFPETLINADPIYYWNFKTAENTKTHDLSAFDPRALEHYRAFISEPDRVHATCEDYRAGRTTDFAIDAVDHREGRKIECPLLVLWGGAGVAAHEASNPVATWDEWATDVRGHAIDSGHFMAEENPADTARALLEFLTA